MGTNQDIKTCCQLTSRLEEIMKGGRNWVTVLYNNKNSNSTSLIFLGTNPAAQEKKDKTIS